MWGHPRSDPEMSYHCSPSSGFYWSKVKITKSDTPIIRMDCHPILTNWRPNLCHSHHFMLDALPGTTLLFILACDRHQICWLAYPEVSLRDKLKYSCLEIRIRIAIDSDETLIKIFTIKNFSVIKIFKGLIMWLIITMHIPNCEQNINARHTPTQQLLKSIFQRKYNNTVSRTGTHHNPVFRVDDMDRTFGSLVITVKHHVSSHSIDQIHLNITCNNYWCYKLPCIQCITKNICNKHSSS